ncbi:hypothetical protein Tco_0572351 [Tanacetum coccineum]
MLVVGLGEWWKSDSENVINKPLKPNLSLMLRKRKKEKKDAAEGGWTVVCQNRKIKKLGLISISNGEPMIVASMEKRSMGFPARHASSSSRLPLLQSEAVPNSGQNVFNLDVLEVPRSRTGFIGDKNGHIVKFSFCPWAFRSQFLVFARSGLRNTWHVVRIAELKIVVDPEEENQCFNLQATSATIMILIVVISMVAYLGYWGGTLMATMLNDALFIIDGLKELTKCKGFQVAPSELEALLLTHPKISDIAVVRYMWQMYMLGSLYNMSKQFNYRSSKDAPNEAEIPAVVLLVLAKLFSFSNKIKLEDVSLDQFFGMDTAISRMRQLLGMANMWVTKVRLSVISYVTYSRDVDPRQVCLSSSTIIEAPKPPKEEAKPAAKEEAKPAAEEEPKPAAKEE